MLLDLSLVSDDSFSRILLILLLLMHALIRCSAHGVFLFSGILVSAAVVFYARSPEVSIPAEEDWVAS